MNLTKNTTHIYAKKKGRTRRKMILKVKKNMKNKLPKMKTLETNHKLNLQTEPIICKLIMKMTSEQILKPKKGFLF